MRVAVIGAGISGLACARSLSAGGAEVLVFDKASRVGGRASTCHMPWGSFDHGAQYFTARGGPFRQLLRHWMDNGIAATWENGAPRIGDSLVSGESLFVGTPGMASLSVALAAGMNIQLDCEVAGIACTAAGSWQLRRRDGRELGTFDWLVSSAPAPLTAELLAPVAPVLAQEAARCHYAPCWSVMARCENWNASGPALIRPTGSPLAWAAHDGIKPGRITQPTWVLQATPEWSRANLDATPDDVCQEMLQAWSSLGAPRVGISSAHCWRNALAETPIGVPCLFDAGLRIGACGDWCIAPRIESAFDSGLALSRAIRRLQAPVEENQAITA